METLQITSSQMRTLSAIRETLMSVYSIIEDGQLVTTRKGWKILVSTFTTQDGTVYKYKISPIGGVLKMTMTVLDSVSATHEAGKVSINIEREGIEDSIVLGYEDFMEQVNARMDIENWNSQEVVYDDYILSVEEFLSHINNDVLIDIFSHNQQ